MLVDHISGVGSEEGHISSENLVVSSIKLSVKLLNYRCTGVDGRMAAFKPITGII